MEEISNLSIGVPYGKISLKDLIDITPIQGILSTIVKVSIVIIAVYILIKIISGIFSAIKYKRIKKTYRNTEEMIGRLSNIEKKLDEILNSAKEKHSRKVK